MMKSTEAYAFVAWIGSTFLFVVYILWALLPEHVLHSYGIRYYPDKSWALAIPSMLVMTILCFYIVYQAMNMASTIPPNSKFQLQDEKSNAFQRKNEYSESMPDIYDIPAPVYNNLLYYQKSVRERYDPQYRRKAESPPASLRSLSDLNNDNFSSVTSKGAVGGASFSHHRNAQKAAPGAGAKKGARAGGAPGGIGRISSTNSLQ